MPQEVLMPFIIPDKDVFSYSAVARLLGVSKTTIFDAVRRGDIQTIPSKTALGIESQNRRQIPVSEVERLARQKGLL